MASLSLREIAATPIGDVTRRAAVEVAPDVPLSDVVAKLGEHKRGAVLVVDRGAVVGLFSERDLMMRVDHGDPSWSKRPVREVMTKSPKTIRADQPIEDAINLMLTGGYRHLPIVDGDDRLVGIVSIRDLLVHIVGFFPADFINLPPDPDREARERWGG